MTHSRISPGSAPRQALALDVAWDGGGYGARLERYPGTVKVLTPRSTVAALRAGIGLVPIWQEFAESVLCRSSKMILGPSASVTNLAAK